MLIGDSSSNIDISTMQRPIVWNIAVYVDHISHAMPHGQVLELNEGIGDNYQVYCGLIQPEDDFFDEREFCDD